MASTTVSDENAAANFSAIGSPTCLLSVFHSTPSAAPQDFPRGGADSISSEWLSRALDAKVTDFRKRICDEGQISLTVVCHDIQYDGDSVGKPRSVALKMSHTDVRKGIFAPMYGMEVFFYTQFRDILETECGIRAPVPLGVWTETTKDGENPSTVAIMMNDLTEDNLGFPPLGPGQATLDDLKAITTEAHKIHSRFLSDPIKTKPPFSFKGDQVHLWDWAPAIPIAHTYLEYCLVTTPNLMKTPDGKKFSDVFPGPYHYPARWQPFMKVFFGRLLANESAGMIEFWDKAHKIWSTRPTTVVHGDLNSGNVWKNKGDCHMLLADWQLMRMAPPAFDFLTMFLLADLAAVGDGGWRRVLEHYHSLLTKSNPDIAKVYTVQIMVDDMAMMIAPFYAFTNTFTSISADPEKVPKDKFDFTWNIFFPLIIDRLGHFVDATDAASIVTSVLDGTYDRWSGFKTQPV